MQIHQSAEDYLETILMLTQRMGRVRSIDVVNDMLADCATATRRIFVGTAHEPPPDELGARVIRIDS